MDYVDPIPPVIQMLKPLFTQRIYGNLFPPNIAMPAILIRNAGGNGYTRLQILVRANSDIDAMQLLIDVMNTLERNASSIQLRGAWIEKESNPLPDRDEVTGKYEAWAYMRMEHLEA
ncbi:hypothetical protein F7731_23555 [Cytobacillus depressus]|uniref:DUF3168 domain-containing protein n=1 Tax=Cytobacillus depressus TaxID=1602942 RepID=A0A6L3UXU8_9BACI|nr:hypothetical protein F7731_23555 [Cytobacillus depressus]